MKISNGEPIDHKFSESDPFSTLYELAENDPKAFIPGSAIYRYAKMNKTRQSRLEIILSSSFYLIKDAGIVAIYGAIIYGTAIIAEELYKKL